MERKRNSTINKTKLHRRVISSFLMLSICTLIFSRTITCQDASRCLMFAKADTEHQSYKEGIGQDMEYEEGKTGIPLNRARKGGPGSSPPQCTSKCGNCTPCRPVHVPVPPGTPVTTEYYPEAWRCKCGNKLNMP